MKILTPSEFKEQNPNAYLGDYLAYLERMQTKTEEDLANAQKYSFDKDVIDSINNQAKEILKMTTIVQKHLEKAILDTIDTLTLIELQSYFIFDEEDMASEPTPEEIEAKKQEIGERLKEIEQKIADDIRQNGREAHFYDAKDVDDFFAQSKEPYEFIEGLLDSLIPEKTYESSAKRLNEQLITALETECRIQNIKLSSEEINKTASEIMGFLEIIKNIQSYPSSAKSQFAQRVLSNTGIKRFLPEGFDKKTATYLIYDLMNLEKLNTSFYLGLPEPLRNRLANGRLRKEPFGTLFSVYQAYLNGEELPCDDLSQEEKEEKRRLEAKLGFLSNERAMRSALRKRISGMMGNQIYAKDIDSIIKDEEIRFKKLKESLSNAGSILSEKMSDLEIAQSIYLDPEYKAFFHAITHNTINRNYRRSGIEMTDEVVLPYIDVEKRRSEQFDIMINLQNRLEEIYNEIITKKRAFFITKKRREKIDALEEQYQNELKACIETLKGRNLVYVDAPRIADTSTVGNIELLPPEEEQRNITDFSELNGLKPALWNTFTGINENIKKKTLEANPLYDSWDAFYQDLMQTYTDLVYKLFSFDIDEDGYYFFATSAEDRERLIKLQTTIIAILTSVYEERKAFRERFGEFTLPVDSEKALELRYFLGPDVNPSRDNLAYYIEITEAKIAEIKELFASHYTLCNELGIAIPEGIEADDEKNIAATTALNDKIQNLAIEGVTNLEEAISHRDILSGLEKYPVPSARVRKYYDEHRKK